jgi:hypothetical protein
LNFTPDNLQERCATATVQQLLERAGIAALVEGQSLRVMVGGGNWISFSAEIRAGADVGALDGLETLRRGRRGKSQDSRWYRSKGFPSLHFEFFSFERPAQVRGHVDAADPARHPIAHLVRDYLPAHGVGTHPTPEALLGMMASNSLG